MRRYEWLSGDTPGSDGLSRPPLVAFYLATAICRPTLDYDQYVHSKLGRAALLLTLMMASFGFATPAQAITVMDPKSMSLNCTTASYSYAGWAMDRDNTGRGTEKYQTRVTDGDGNNLFAADIELPLGARESMPGSSFEYATAPTRNPITFTITSLAGNGHPEQVAWEATGTCPGLPSGSIPVVTPPTFQAEPGQSVQGSLAQYASDPDGDVLTFSLLSSPVNGVVVLNSSGTFNFTPAVSGSDSFIVVVSDGRENSAHMQVSFVTAYTSTVSLTASANSAEVGTLVALEAEVSTPAATLLPTGSVEFFNGPESLGTRPVVAGMVSIDLPALSVGTHSLTAVYSGDDAFRTGTSRAVVVSIERAVTTTTLELEAGSITVGDAAQFAATVTGITPTGDVQFFAGGELLGVAPLVAGTAVLDAPGLTEGIHSIIAEYGGDKNNAVSASGVSSLVVAPVDPAPKPEPKPDTDPIPDAGTDPVQDPDPRGERESERNRDATHVGPAQGSAPVATLASTGAVSGVITLVAALLLAGSGAVVLTGRRNKHSGHSAG